MHGVIFVCLSLGFGLCLTIRGLPCDVRRYGHDYVDDQVPEGHQRHKVVELIGAVHDETQGHHQHVHTKQHLGRGRDESERVRGESD